MGEIEEAVKEFMSKNGNRRVKTSDLVIYFNERHDKRIDKLEEKIDNLPCESNMLLFNTKIDNIYKHLSDEKKEKKKDVKWIITTVIAVTAVIIAFTSIFII